MLLVDDDTDFADITAYGLSRAGFELVRARSGEEALAIFEEDPPDMILLDVELPDISGIEVCRRIRQRSNIPIVFVSAHRAESDIMSAYEAGADDYATKPVSIHQLAMKLRALHARASGSAGQMTPNYVVAGKLEIDAGSFNASIGGVPLRLTLREFRLLYILAANAGRVVPSSKLVDFAWGLEAESDVTLIKTHLSHIRNKLREAGDTSIQIRAVAGMGYRLEISS